MRESGSWAAGESRQPAVALATLAQLFASGWMLGTMHYSGLWSEAAGSSREGRIACRRVSRANKQNKTKTSSHLELMDPLVHLFFFILKHCEIYLFICSNPINFLGVFRLVKCQDF